MTDVTARAGSSPIPALNGVAAYLRVSTGRQAENDLSIPDQRRQIEGYCAARGWAMVEAFVEPGSSATDDRRPAFQAMIDAALAKPPTFDVILVHSFSRFFRDQLQFELYARKLAKNGVRIVSITQETGDEPMGVMMRKIVTLFDEYQSKENAKHTLRAMCENARQGFWNGSRPPIGYRTVEAGKRGAKVKKTLEVDPLHADTVRLIYRLALEGAEGSGPMGLKAIATFLNARDVRTRDGGRWGISGVHEVLTRTTYVGQHRFNRRDARSKTAKADSEHAIMAVPPLIAEADFQEVQNLLRSRSPKITPPRTVGGATLLTAIGFCAACGGGMALRTGTSSAGRSYRYYACSTKARQGPVGCCGVSVRADRLDELLIEFLVSDLFASGRLETLLAPFLTHRDAWAERRRKHVSDLRIRAAEAELKLRRLFEAIENGTLTGPDRMFGERVAELSAVRDQAEADADRVEAMVDQATPSLALDDVHRMAEDVRSRLRSGPWAMQRPHVRALLQRVEVVSKQEIRVSGSRSALLKALVTASGGRTTVLPGRLALAWRNAPDTDDAYTLTSPM